MNEHDRQGNKFKESETEEKSERVRFVFGKGLTPKQMADEIKRSYREHFGTEMFPREDKKWHEHVFAMGTMRIVDPKVRGYEHHGG